MIETSSPVYQALCKVLSGQRATVAWGEFSPVDWQQLALVAQAERVAPLLCHSFRREGWPAQMPDAVQMALSRDFYNAAAQGGLLFRALEHILSELNRAGIEAILLKGAALAATLYPDIALRPMGDLDLLIRDSDLSAAINLVEGLGYEPETPPMRRGLEHLVFYEVNFRGGEHAWTQVELHWDLVGGAGSRYRPSIEWFWGQTRAVGVGSSMAMVLSPAAHFLHAAVHLSLKHGGDDARLIWLYDLHLIITQCPDLDWAQVLEKSREFHWAPAVHSVLGELGRTFFTAIPAWILDACAQEDDPETRVLVQRMAVSGHSRISGALAHFAFLSWAARFQWLAAVIFPDPAYMRWRYRPKPSWLWPVCYAVRWADMGSEFLMAIPRRLFH